MSVHDWDSFIAMLEARRRSNFDNVIAVVGDEGDGKSTLGMHTCQALDADFDPGRDTIFNFEDWSAKFDTRRKGLVYLLDEGGNLAFNRDWSHGENKHVQHILREARQFNHTLVFCIPKLAWLDKNLREHRIRWVLHTYSLGLERGYAGLFERKRQKFPNEETYFAPPIDVDEVQIRFGPYDGPGLDEYERRKLEATRGRIGAFMAARKPKPKRNRTLNGKLNGHVASGERDGGPVGLREAPSQDGMVTETE